MSGGRERGRCPSRGGLLEHDDAADEVGPEDSAQTDGEGDAIRHPRRRNRSPPWWRSRTPYAARRGGGGRATLHSTAAHPSATPSRATPTSCSALASENRIYVDLRERDVERSIESERG
jgi:hypothetical protein